MYTGRPELPLLLPFYQHKLLGRHLTLKRCPNPNFCQNLDLTLQKYAFGTNVHVQLYT